MNSLSDLSQRFEAARIDAMFRSRKYKEEHRYYLLPGMGRSNKRFRRKTVYVAVVVGIITSAFFAVALYFANQ